MKGKLMRRMKHYRTLILAAAIAGLSGSKAAAQSADALIDKLVDKGILTVKEATALREEADNNFTQAYSVKSGMPDWVNALKFSGDIRTRYEGFYSDQQVEKINSVTGTPYFDKLENRNRFRYRLRFGATASMFDNLEAGFRLTSSEPASPASSNFGGNPLSGNQTFRDDFSKKFVYIDQAYARWYALNEPDFSTILTLGKMENPFVFDDMVWDPDITPEGGAFQAAYRPSDAHTLSLIGAAFVMDETALGGSTSTTGGNGGGNGHNPYMLAAQLRWDAIWTKKISTSAGLAYLAIQHQDQLFTAAVPDQNAGNTRTLASSGIAGTSTFIPAGSLVYAYRPYVADASVTYTLDSFPLYNGAFPIKAGGEYMNNPGAPYHADNYGWNAGATVGKAGKRGTWEFNYTYKWLGGDAWFEELVDDDTGAIYTGIPTAGTARAPSSGLFTGTNVKGHVLRFSYSPTDALTLTAKAFLYDLIQAFPVGSGSSETRLQVDASLRF